MSDHITNVDLDCISSSFDEPFQAWVSGFRAGVKLCLVNGVRLTLSNFKEQTQENIDLLSIWHNVGRDVKNGIWSILGARMGTYMTMITPNWDYNDLENDTALKLIYDTIKYDSPEHIAGRIAPDLINQLDLPIVMLDENASKFFRHHCSKLA